MELFVGVQDGFAGQVDPQPPAYNSANNVMARLLIAVLAATTVSAFKTPKSRALKVRGGIDIQKLGTALIGRCSETARKKGLSLQLCVA